MKPPRPLLPSLVLGAGLLLGTGCGQHDHDHDHDHDPVGAHSGHGHVHTPPHGGTPVILGKETYHLELVHDVGRGILQVFVLDGHMEDFTRCDAASFEIIATTTGEIYPLTFLPVTDAATGEKPGDASLFEAPAPWLKPGGSFDGVLTSLTIRGSTFTGVTFRYPEGHGQSH